MALQSSQSMILDQRTSFSMSSNSDRKFRSASWSGRGPAQLPEFEMDDKTKRKFEGEIDWAVKIVDKFFNPKLIKDSAIPKELLNEAHGLVFISMIKGGFLLAGKVGKGFVVGRTATGWSAPSFISTGGLGFGMMVGGEVVHYIIILGSRGAVKTFTRNGQVQIGSELDVAMGPIGRAASASLNIGKGGIAPNYSYSHCVGLYGGIGLASAVIITRKSFNSRCYGKIRSVRDILSGAVQTPYMKKLIDRLDAAMGIERPALIISNHLNSGSGPSDHRGVKCDACFGWNTFDSRECRSCKHLLIFTIGPHSGRRISGKLVRTPEEELRQE